MGNKSLFLKIVQLTFFMLVFAAWAQAYNLPNNKQITKVEEKVVLVCDRDFYLSGEKILFTAQTFIDNEVDMNLSKVLYLELYKGNQSFAKAKYKLESGRVESIFEIPEDIVSGNYYLRAYTMFMRNQRPETFFNKHITIVNPERKLDTYFGNYSKPINFSNAKNTYSGIKNEFAVLFNAEFFAKIDEAIIVDQKNDSITKVETFKNGLGSFSFVPKEDEVYLMKVKLHKEDSLFIKLNKSVSGGVSVSFDQKSSIAKIVSSASRINQIKILELYSPDFKLIESVTASIKDSLNIIRFHKIDFPKGISYLLIKNENKVFESLHPFFVGENNSPKAVIELLKNNFSKREKVDFNLSGLSRNDVVTVSVIKQISLKENKEVLPKKFIFNPLLLNYNINSSSLSETIKKQIELSLLFNNEVFNSSEFIKNFVESSGEALKLPEIRDLSISGKIINPFTKKGIANQRVYVSVLGQNPQLHTMKTDESGAFVFSLNQLQGIQDVGLSIDSIENVSAEIIVDNDFSSSFPAFIDFPVQADSTYGDFIVNMFKNKQIGYSFKEVIETHVSDYDCIPFPFQEPQASIKIADYIDLSTLQEVFNEIVTYVVARKQKGHYVLNVLNDKNETLYRRPLVLVDKLAVFDVDEIMNIKPGQIDKIEVITSPYTLGDHRFNGIIMINTKADNFGGMKLSDETIFLKYITSKPGSQLAFPNFETDKLITENRPFFANTIFWETQRVDSDTKPGFSFFTSDESGYFNIKISVIKADGSIESQIKTIRVK